MSLFKVSPKEPINVLDIISKTHKIIPNFTFSHDTCQVFCILQNLYNQVLFNISIFPRTTLVSLYLAELKTLASLFWSILVVLFCKWLSENSAYYFFF